MLVLTRKPGEKIVVGSNITLTVVAIEGNKIRIGIDAPSSVRILRSELFDVLKQQAATVKDDDADLQAKPAEWHDVGPDLVVSR